MELAQSQKMEQKLILTQEMRQSLAVLQMPLPELRSYIQDAALCNPLIELEYENEPAPQLTSERATTEQDDTDRWSDPLVSSRSRENPGPVCRASRTGADVSFVDWVSTDDSENFFDMLREQLLRMEWLDDFTARLCQYLIDCLDERGYLRFDLQELAKEQGVPIGNMEQALYVLQSLQPTGVGARSLEECLLLQLAQSRHFCSDTVQLVRQGLNLLGRRDYSAIAHLLQCSPSRARKAAQAVCELNPIPSQGYATGSTTEYQFPEAQVLIEDGQIVLEMERRLLPGIRIDHTVEQLLRQEGRKEDLNYLKTEIREAHSLMRFVEERQSTLGQLIQIIVEIQAGYFLHGEPLVSVTMSQLAQRMQVSCSTISRAIQGKYLQFGRQVLPLKKLLSTPLHGGTSSDISSDRVKRQLAALIAAEDPEDPLSDETLRAALCDTLDVSRRTVAKYREELGIPSSFRRKKAHPAAPRKKRTQKSCCC